MISILYFDGQDLRGPDKPYNCPGVDQGNDRIAAVDLPPLPIRPTRHEAAGHDALGARPLPVIVVEVAVGGCLPSYLCSVVHNSLRFWLASIAAKVDGSSAPCFAEEPSLRPYYCVFPHFPT